MNKNYSDRMKCNPYRKVTAGWARGLDSCLHTFPTNKTTTTSSSGLDFYLTSLPCKWKYESISYWDKLCWEPLSQTTFFTLGQVGSKNAPTFSVGPSKSILVRHMGMCYRKLFFCALRKMNFDLSDNFLITFQFIICNETNVKF